MIQDRLLALRDEKYAAFTAKLIPNIDPSRIVGVRAPQLAQLAKELKLVSSWPYCPIVSSRRMAYMQRCSTA